MRLMLFIKGKPAIATKCGNSLKSILFDINYKTLPRFAGVQLDRLQLIMSSCESNDMIQISHDWHKCDSINIRLVINLSQQIW